jgi:hypothetical protein
MVLSRMLPRTRRVECRVVSSLGSDDIRVAAWMYDEDTYRLDPRSASQKRALCWLLFVVES